MNINFDTLARVNYSRQSHLHDAAINRAQQQHFKGTNKSLRRSKQSSLT